MSSILEKLITLPSDQDITGRTFDKEEISAVTEALLSGTLTSTKGNFVKSFEQGFAALLGSKYAHACASGSAAIHTAIAAIDPNPGDEIVTTSITDMGALTPIIYQGAIPVFADVDPRSCNVTAKTIEKVLSDRTRAIIVTHLFGNPCDMREIMELARSRNIPVIEDCAQAFLSKYENQIIGTIGDIGAFSLQQGKHISTGEGGVVVSNNEYLARRMFLFINKAWGYGDEKPDHYFLALNYRMSELQGAVASAQLNKLKDVVQNRIQLANKLTRKITGLKGIETPYVDPKSSHTYWKYCLRIDSRVITDGAVGMAKLLKEKGIASAPRYIQKPAFRCEIFEKQQTFGSSRFPFTLARPEAVDYSAERFPGTFQALERILVLPWNEKYTEEHIDYIADAIHEAVIRLTK
jgi:perosamine synthetase